MDDTRIIDLYFERNEDAIKETSDKYGRFCHSIAYNILHSNEDAEECVNDTYLRVWNSIPPTKPTKFSAFIGRITRNLALDRIDEKHAKKRGSFYYEIALSELEECIPNKDSLDNIADEIFMREVINSFLSSLPKQTRIIFMRRYWYLCSVEEIATSLSLSLSNVKTTLFRTRKKFKAHLEKHGVCVK